MPVFPSLEWCQAVVDAIHSEPDSRKAGKGLVADFAAAILPEGRLQEPFIVFGKAVEGRVETLRLLEDLDEIEEIEPAYVARAGYSAWRQIIESRLDPIEAILRKQIEVSGDLQPIIERAQFKDLVWRVLAKVPTTFQ
ncbi:MAG TPA: hypothetical protein VGK67_41100 [Myxococcales bacterium]|jgi:hypothetical protein